MSSLPDRLESSRSSQVGGFALPDISLSQRSLLITSPKMPTYQPVQLPSGSFRLASTAAAFGELYGSSSPSFPRGSWNSLDPPMKISALGEFFSVRMRV